MSDTPMNPWFAWTDEGLDLLDHMIRTTKLNPSGYRIQELLILEAQLDAELERRKK